MTDETMSTLTVTPSMSSQISFERFPLKGVLGVKGVLAWAHRRARALKELQIEAFYARARTQDPIHPEDLFQGKFC